MGSSPRVRGKRVRGRRGRGVGGLIPACAEKTPARASATSDSPAHPRVCGENLAAAAAGASTLGSSPRVRGKPGQWHAEGQPGRLIPACAGKTKVCVVTTPPDRAHPRVCGENSACDGQHTPASGSSPRVRGKHHQIRRAGRVGGLIPACAGKT
ncbi:hypothetical protein HMPREF9005_1167 [Actinomyces sp. oral taxon 178 str. F0338]|nr:hypothetical protein HMPREF9005_1167 [Actinomyces sp. oral taxon 178 str. F0338]